MKIKKIEEIFKKINGINIPKKKCMQRVRIKEVELKKLH